MTISGQAVSIYDFKGDIIKEDNPLPTSIYNPSGLELNIDSVSGAMTVVHHSHKEIHSGDHYFNKDWVDLANAATYDILLITPDTTTWGHFLFSMNAEGEFNVEIFIDPTVSANGTALNFINRNGNSSNTATLLGYHTPTVTTTGTSFARYKGGSMNRVGGEVRSENEIILKQNTLFLIRITNDTALNNWVSWLIDFYEHESL